MKRAQGLSIQTIILAVLGMLVLIVILWNVGKGAIGFNSQVSDCENKGGVCTEYGCRYGYEESPLKCDKGTCCQVIIEQEESKVIIHDG